MHVIGQEGKVVKERFDGGGNRKGGSVWIVVGRLCGSRDWRIEGAMVWRRS